MSTLQWFCYISAFSRFSTFPIFLRVDDENVEKQMESDESENTEEKSDLEVEKTSENEKISEESVEE